MAIVWLDDPLGADLADLGGKGAGLVRLVRAGYAVPPGFVVPASVHRRALAAAGIERELREAELAFPHGDPVAGAEAAAALRARVELLELAPEDEAAIRNALEELGEGPPAGSAAAPRDVLAPAGSAAAPRGVLAPAGSAAAPRGVPVAVRSSALLEDLPDASFAGQHDTYLGVRGGDAVVAAVRAAWASLYTARALAYRHRVGLAGEELACAVVVQTLAPTEVAGVTFTCDPATGSPDRIHLEATWGLGEGLVSGGVEPDRWILDRDTLEVREEGRGSKLRRVVPTADGETRGEEVPEALRDVPCLEPETVVALARMARDIEELLGVAADVEWGLVKGEVVLLQARPVTWVLPLPPPAEDWVSERWLSNANFAETMPDPPSPLGWSIFGGLAEELLQPPRWARPFTEAVPLVQLVHGRPYWDVTGVFFHTHLLPVVATVDRVTARVLAAALDEGRGPRFSLRRFLGVFRPLGALALVLLHIPPLLLGFLRVVLDPVACAARLREAGDTLARRRADLGDPSRPLADQARELDAVIEEALTFAHVLKVPFLVQAAALLQLTAMAREAGLEGAEAGGSRLGAGDTPSWTERMGTALHALARTARDEPGVAEVLADPDPDAAWARIHEDHGEGPFVRGLGRFLEDFGHRSPAEQDLEKPRFVEDPRVLLPILRAQLGVTDPARDPEVRRAADAAARAAFGAELEARLRADAWIPWLPVRAWHYRFLMRISEPLFAFREDAKHYVFSAYLGYKRHVVALGLRLAEEDLLTRPDDVFYLERQELHAWVAAGCPDPDEVRATVLRRRLERERHRAHAAPMVLTNRGRVFFPEAEEEVDSEGVRCLRGQGASAGVIRGRVRVLRDPSEAHLLQPGEILVCPFTDPGWTPLFMVAGGLAMDVGGLLCHGATVAREVGIPAVVGLGKATDILEDGQEVQLDGREGVVRILEEPR